MCDHDTVINIIKYKGTFNNGIAESLITICSFKRFCSFICLEQNLLKEQMVINLSAMPLLKVPLNLIMFITVS